MIRTTHEELLAKLTDHEDQFVERKPEGVNASDIRKAAVAFSNSVPPGREAILFIGIFEDDRIQGCQNPDDKQKAVQAACQSCYPPISPTSVVLEVGGKLVVAVVFAASEDRPHFSGGAYVRRGSQSITASPEMFADLVHSRNSTAAAILRLKGDVVTVTSIDHKLGDVRRLTGMDPEITECRVIDCDAQAVRLEVLGSGRRVSESLSRIDVKPDEERHRSMLVVKGY